MDSLFGIGDFKSAITSTCIGDSVRIGLGSHWSPIWASCPARPKTINSPPAVVSFSIMAMIPPISIRADVSIMNQST